MGGILLIGVINLVRANAITNSPKKIWFLKLDSLAYAYTIENFEGKP